MSASYALGPDPEGDLANKSRIADAASEIVEGLRTYLDHGCNSPLVALLKQSASYKGGLTNIETMLATQMALAIYQVDLVNQIAEMNMGSEDYL